MIEFRNVTKSYGDNIGLSDINITIDDGEFVFLVGPSGAGKSTFIKLILKEIDPDQGHIFFDGRDITRLSKRLIPALRRDLGIVFQDFRLLPKKTVYENVAFAMEAVHQRKRLIYKQVPHILKLVGISEQAERYPHELSGGEAQRVAIARAIVNNPKVLIADEPTGNLDPEKSWEIMNLLEQINLRGTTVVMVTHAKDIVDRMGKRVIQINEGSIVRDDAAGFYIQTDNPEEEPLSGIFSGAGEVFSPGLLNEELSSGFSEEDLSIFGGSEVIPDGEIVETDTQTDIYAADADVKAGYDGSRPDEKSLPEEQSAAEKDDMEKSPQEAAGRTEEERKTAGAKAKRGTSSANRSGAKRRGKKKGGGRR